MAEMETPDKGFFDHFAEWTSNAVSRAPFFAFCVLLVVFWAIEGLAKVAADGSWAAFLDDKYQLQINTTTTIVTFWLVSLLQNTQARSDTAQQRKLDALAIGLRDLMVHVQDPQSSETDFAEDIAALEKAIGIEIETGTKKSSS